MNEVNTKSNTEVSKGAGLEGPPPGERPYYGSEGDEIDLFELIQRIWRQKLVVVLAVVLCVAVALAYLFTTSPLYEVNMLVRPGVTAYEGEKEIRGWTVNDIVAWVHTGQYRDLLPANSASGEERIPKLKAKASRASNAVTFFLYNPNPAEGEKLLQGLYSNFIQYYVKKDGDREVALTKKILLNQIQTLQDQLKELTLVERAKLNMQILDLKEEIKMYNQKIEITRDRQRTGTNTLKEIRDRVTATLKNTGDLVRLRNNLIAQQRTQDISLLLYTNIIQQNIYYLSNLQWQIAALEKAILDEKEQEVELHKEVYKINQEIEKTRLEIEQELQHKREDLNRQISLAKDRVKALAPIEKISGPMASERPVKPKKPLILALAGVLGIFLGIFLALFIDAYISRKKARA